jgi:hypothetical protein
MLRPELHHAARQALNKKMAKNKSKYRTQFDEAALWERLAWKQGIRLPAWWLAPEPRLIRRYLRLLKISESSYRQACGEGWTVETFAEKFPDYPLRAFVGNLLQYHHSLQLAKEKLNNILIGESNV